MPRVVARFGVGDIFVPAGRVASHVEAFGGSDQAVTAVHELGHRVGNDSVDGALVGLVVEDEVGLRVRVGNLAVDVARVASALADRVTALKGGKRKRDEGVV